MTNKWVNLERETSVIGEQTQKRCQGTGISCAFVGNWRSDTVGWWWYVISITAENPAYDTAKAHGIENRHLRQQKHNLFPSTVPLGGTFLFSRCSRKSHPAGHPLASWLAHRLSHLMGHIYLFIDQMKQMNDPQTGSSTICYLNRAWSSCKWLVLLVKKSVLVQNK